MSGMGGLSGLALYLEAANAALFVICSAIVCVLAIYIAKGFYMAFNNQAAMGHYRGRPGADIVVLSLAVGYQQRQGAIAIFALALGEVLLRAPVWWMRVLENTGHDVSGYVQFTWLMIVIGSIVEGAGGICFMRHFSPAAWGAWPWRLTLILAVLLSSRPFF